MSEFEVAFPEQRRFDDRRLLIEDDGRDFESFVYEALSLLVGADTLRPGFGRGRDGAIDHMIEIAENRTVVECKFIGRNAGSSPRDRWNEVRRHLNENLPKLAAKDISQRSRSPYGPWLDSEHPISGYQFCVSFAFSHVEERSALEKRIADDFLELSRKDPRLSHLADIHVRVRGWEDFYGELRRRFSLRYRWFGDLPRGIAPLREKRFESQSFRRFLFEDSLPFFSREEYLAANFGQQITREDQFVSNLSAERGDEALIVTGAGGVGKTRLGFELCDRLSNLGWLALRLTDSATSASVADLIRAQVEPAQIVLFSDYAERADDLNAIAEEISLVNDRNAHRIRLIATCRISALSTVEDTLASLVLRKATLGTPRASEPAEIAFADWVVRQILAYGRIPDSEQIAQVCMGLPILAAFAFFLHERDPAQFTRQFGDLAGIRDFRNWVKRRLDTALYTWRPTHDQRESLKHIALLSLRLPMEKSEADDLVDLSSLDASLLEMMRADRWIEDDHNQLMATHDVFADAMVGSYVFETRAVAQSRLTQLLRIATDQGFLGRALLAIDRLSGHPDFDAVDAIAVIHSLISRSPALVVAVHERLLRGRFLSDREKIELLTEQPAIHAAILSNRDCDASVSHVAESLARLRRHDPDASDSFLEEAVEVIRPLVAASLANPHPSNMILRRAFALLPEVYRATVLARIRKEPNASHTHYLLVAWLNARFPTEQVSPAIETWLDENARWNPKTSFIIRAWLEAGGKRDFIDRHVIAWIETFGTTEAARFVYRSWLDAGGERNLIDQHVVAWIEAFGTTQDASFVYRAWLDTGGKRDAIDQHVVAWIEAFGTTKGASFIYQAWLQTGGKRDLIDHRVVAWIEAFGTTEPAQFVYRIWLDAGGKRDLIDRHVLAWIEAFGSIEVARFVFRSWLDAGGKRDLIDRHVLAWIEVFGTNEAARSVYRSWLDAGGERELIDRHVLAWIETFGTIEDARFIYQSWLDAGGERELIDRHVLAWIEAFGSTEDASFVYKAWLHAGGEFEAVSQWCLDWFRNNFKSPAAAFVLKYISDQEQLPIAALHAVIRWCAYFAKDEDAIWRIAATLGRHYKSSEGVALVRAFILVLYHFDQRRLEIDTSSESGKSTRPTGALLSFVILNSIGRAVLVQGLDERDRHNLAAAHSRLLTESSIYSSVCVGGQPSSLPSLVHHVAEILESGTIDVNRDCKRLLQFADWMRAWPSDSTGDLDLAVSRLRRAAPLALWDDIPAPKGAHQELATQ